MKSFPTFPEFHPQHPRTALRPYRGHGLFITATNTDAGKTSVTAALAGALHRLHLRVGLCKPVASGCPKYPDRGNDPNLPLTDRDIIPTDSIIAARAAGFDPNDETLMAYMSPIRYAAPITPHIAAQIEERPPDWRRVAAALDWWQENSDVLLVEGAGGWYTPLDQHDFTIADLATTLRLPVLVVCHAGMGAITHAMLAIHAIRSRNLAVAGIILNRIPDEPDRGMIISSNLIEIPRLTGVPVRAILPDLGPDAFTDAIPESLIDELMPFAKDWSQMLKEQ